MSRLTHWLKHETKEILKASLLFRAQLYLSTYLFSFYSSNLTFNTSKQLSTNLFVLCRRIFVRECVAVINIGHDSYQFREEKTAVRFTQIFLPWIAHLFFFRIQELVELKCHFSKKNAKYLIEIWQPRKISMFPYYHYFYHVNNVFSCTTFINITSSPSTTTTSYYYSFY